MIVHSSLICGTCSSIAAAACMLLFLASNNLERSVILVLKFGVLFFSPGTDFSPDLFSWVFLFKTKQRKEIAVV